jgi:hypothetical protein
MRMIIDFTNLKEFSYESMESFQRRYNIFFSEEGRNTGFERACFSKNSDSIFLFYSSPGLQISSNNVFLSASKENEIRMADCLKKSQNGYHDFLMECVDGRLPINFVKQSLSHFKGSILTVIPTKDLFRVSFELLLVPRNIESYLDVYEILYPLWRREEEKFSRIKRCKNCSNFFVAKSLKAEFCSVKCKNFLNYRKKIKNFDR